MYRDVQVPKDVISGDNFVTHPQNDGERLADNSRLKIINVRLGFKL